LPAARAVLYIFFPKKDAAAIANAAMPAISFTAVQQFAGPATSACRTRTLRWLVNASARITAGSCFPD
jgi:hypothetical protein